MLEAGLYVVRPPGAHLPGKVRALVDALVERFGGEPDWDACEMRALELGTGHRPAGPRVAAGLPSMLEAADSPEPATLS